MFLSFKPNTTPLTLGVEMEIQLLDAESLQLVPMAPAILELLQGDKLTKELFRSTLELITGVCQDVHEVKQDLSQTLERVNAAGKKLGITFSGTGTHPLADYNAQILSASTRYAELIDRNQWLIRRMAVYGLHIHIGMRDGDACIRFMNFYLHFIPHLIALSASSPYWKGTDTGLDASRPTTYEAHPTSGLPYIVNNWSEFNALYQSLLRVGSIKSMKDIWWDMRPSPTFGTLEIRICDGPASMFELEAIVAFVHMLAFWFDEHGEEVESILELAPEEWILRENKWRAIRYGLKAELISHRTLTLRSMADSISQWLDRLEPYAERLGYTSYLDNIRVLLMKGNSATRQRKVMATTGDLMEVIKHNLEEFERKEPKWE